jgi:hypothetical protein
LVASAGIGFWQQAELIGLRFRSIENQHNIGGSTGGDGLRVLHTLWRCRALSTLDRWLMGRHSLRRSDHHDEQQAQSDGRYDGELTLHVDLLRKPVRDQVIESMIEQIE